MATNAKPFGDPESAHAEHVAPRACFFRSRANVEATRAGFENAARRLFSCPSSSPNPTGTEAGIHPADLPKWVQLQEDLREHGEGVADFRWREPNGRFQQIQARLHVEENPGNAPQEVVGLVIAVNRKPSLTRSTGGARRQDPTEAELPLEQEPPASSPLPPAVLRMLVESSRLPMCLCDGDGRLLCANPVFADLFGGGVPQFPTLEAWTERCVDNPQVLSERWPEVIRRLSANGRAGVIRNLHAATLLKGMRELQIRFHVMDSSVLVTFEDLTEAHLAMAESPGGDANRTIPAAFYICQPKYPFSLLHFDPSVRELTGFSADTFIHDHTRWYQRVHPQDHAEVEASIARLQRTGRMALVHRFLHADNHYRRLFSESRMLKGRDGEPVEMFGCMVELGPGCGESAAAVECARQNDAYVARRVGELLIERESLKRDWRPLRLLVEHSPVPMAILDPAGGVEYLNATFTAAFGLGEESARGITDWLQLLIPDPATRDAAVAFWREEMPAHLASGEPVPTRIWRMQAASGQTLQVQVRSAWVDSRLLVAFEDVTALANAEARLRRLTRHASTLLLELSPDGRVTFANRDFDGRPADFILGRHLRELGCESPLLDAFTRTVESLEPVAFDHQRRGADGDIREFTSCFTPVGDGSGLRWIVLTSTDTTERSRMNETLRMRTAALEAATDGVAIVEARPGCCPIVYVDPAFERLTGWSSQESPLHNCSDLVCHESTPEETLKAMHSALRGGAGFAGEVILRRRDSSTFWSRLRIMPHVNTTGIVTHFVWLILDITEQKEAEENRRQQREELARLERLAAMGEITAGFAHELAQPISAIVGNASAALSFSSQCSKGCCANTDALKDILHSIARLRGVFNRIRDLGRADTQIRHLTDVNTVIRDATRLVSGDAAARGIRLRLRCHDALPKLWLDHVQIRQVLVNLLSNAFDAVAAEPTRHRRVEVAAEPAPEGGVMISVRDHGPGIPADILPQLLDRSLTTKPTGNGIGLRLCRRMVEAHQGTIQAENHGTRGATFRVTLPVGGEIQA